MGVKMQLKADTHVISRSGEELGELAAALETVTRGAEVALDAAAGAVGHPALAEGLRDLQASLRQAHQRLLTALARLGRDALLGAHGMDRADRRLALPAGGGGR
jgi:hypothetical protein